MKTQEKIFKVVSIIQLTFLFLIIVLTGISFIKIYKGFSITGENMMGIVSGFLVFLAALPFHALCIQMATKFYPDKEISFRFNLFFAISYIIAVIGEILLIIIIVMAINNVRNTVSITQIKFEQKVILFLFLLYLASNLYSFVYAIKFRNQIGRNFIENQNQSIETLGSRNIDLL